MGACACSMVDFPKPGDRVYYFPQGHLEQLEESTGLKLDHNLSSVNLSSKIHCRVVNIQLRADEDDEAFAQITLLPERITGDHLQPSEYAESRRPQIPKPKFHSFFKVLSESDRNGHCRLHVLKQHADKCLPPLDMTQQEPSQELLVRDLRGIEWTFRHVFKGQPGRHLFTTGWSEFVTSKRLVARDFFGFFRGENGELRVGIRRRAPPCISKPSSWVPSEILDGVLESVSQAIATGTKFTVNYRPRFRKSLFVIGLDKYQEAANHGLSVGTRYSMQFKGEDLIQRKYVGTIIEVDDIDPRWPNSEWRLLKVHWDESTSITRPERVTPWEIEPLVESVPPRLVPLVESKNKDEMPSSQVLKKRKRKPGLQEKGMEDLGATTQELSQPTVLSSESVGKRCADMVVPALETCRNFDNEAALEEPNNEEYIYVDDPNSCDRSEHMRSHPLGLRTASSTDDITQPTGHGQSNQVLIDELEGRGQVEGHCISEIARSVPSFTSASDRSDSWLTALLRDIPEQYECQSEPSPLREQHLLKDPCMPLQQTSSTELSRSPKVICISSTPTQIPFNETGNENELINWKTYQVARHCVPILDRVIAQYPDTLKGFRAMSDTLQSTLLEILAKVVDMLEQHTVGNLGMEHLENARRHLTDLKTNGIDMSWLDGRLNLIHRVCNKNILVQRREELTMEVAEASAKLRHLEGKLSSIDMELEEIASRVDTYPLSTDQSVIQGLL